MLCTDKKQFHIGTTHDQIGGYCILPGDPGRCEAIASYLENATHISSNREFNIYTGYLSGEKVTVCSTGIGGPSAAIAVEELAACGAHTMLRIGTCGGISKKVCAGDIVIASAAVRQDGTSREYAPIEFPATSDTEMLFSISESAKKLGVPHHIGIVQSKDSFYGQHSPESMPTACELAAKWEAWKRLGVLASEMETAAIFTVGASRGVRCGALFACIWNQERAYAGLDGAEDKILDTTIAVRVAVSSLKLLIEKDKNKEKNRL